MQIGDKFNSLVGKDTYTVVEVYPSEVMIEAESDKRHIKATNEGYVGVISYPVGYNIQLIDPNKPLITISRGNFYECSSGTFWYVRSYKDNTIVAVSICDKPESKSWSGTSHPLVRRVHAQFFRAK